MDRRAIELVPSATGVDRAGERSAMILAALGVVTVVLGFVLPASGLTFVGAIWIVGGLVLRVHNRRIEAKRADNLERAAAGEVITEEVVTAPTFAVGIVLVLAVAVPSVVVGVAALGFDETDRAWRWLPLVVGLICIVLVVLSLLMAWSGTRAPASKGGLSEVPAKITILAARETMLRVNDRPGVDFDLRVEPVDGTSFEHTQKIVVPFTALGSIEPGREHAGTVRGTGAAARVTIAWGEPMPEPFR